MVLQVAYDFLYVFNDISWIMPKWTEQFFDVRVTVEDSYLVLIRIQRQVVRVILCY